MTLNGGSSMRRSILSALLALAAGVVPASGGTAAAQEIANASYERGPRFLLATSTEVVPVDVSRTAVLARRLSLDLEGATLKQALAEITSRSGLRLAYSDDVMPLDKRVHLRAEAITAAAALTDVLFDSGVDVVFRADGSAALVRRRAAAPVQEGVIVGRVTDTRGDEPIAGAAVTVEGTTHGATSDGDGRYRIERVPAGSYTIRARYIGYAPLGLPVTVTAGQEITTDFTLSAYVARMDEIVVAGTLVESRRRESPVPVAVIEEEKIRTPSRTRIDQVFRGDVPGIIGIEGSPTQSGAYMFVRGRASLNTENLVKVYVDGVETPSSSLISAIDLQNVERMELLRGPQASSVYGSNASGGVLLIFTKEGATGAPRFSGSASVGTTASDFAADDPLTMEHRLNVAGGGEGFTYSVGGSFNSAGDWITQGDSRQAGFTGRGTFTQGPFRFSLSSMYSNRVLGYADPPGAAVLVPLFPEFGLPNNTDISTNYQLLGASATYAPNERWETTLILGSSDITDQARQYEPERATPEDTTYNTWLGADDQLSARLHSTLSLQPSSRLRSTTTLGFEVARYKSEYLEVDLFEPTTEYQQPAPGGFVTPERTSNSRGAFLQQVIGVNDRLFLTGAVRAEYNSNFGANDRVAWAPRLGAAYLLELAPGVALKPRASYGKSVRPPDPAQAGGSRSALYVQQANPDLRPEIQRGFDAGFDLELENGLLVLEATYFHQTADDLIDLTVFSFADPDAGTPNVFQYQNIGTVTNRGLELGVRSRLGPADLIGSYTYVRNKVKALNEDYLGALLVDDQLTYAPRHTAGGTVGLNFPSVFGRGRDLARLEFGVTYIGERTTEDNIGFAACLFGLQACIDDTPDERDYWIRLPGFAKFRIGVTQPLGRDLDAFVNVDNLANRQEGEFFAFAPARGRAVLLGLRYGE